MNGVRKTMDSGDASRLQLLSLLRHVEQRGHRRGPVPSFGEDPEHRSGPARGRRAEVYRTAADSATEGDVKSGKHGATPQQRLLSRSRAASGEPMKVMDDEG